MDRKSCWLCLKEDGNLATEQASEGCLASQWKEEEGKGKQSVACEAVEKPRDPWRDPRFPSSGTALPHDRHAGVDALPASQSHATEAGVTGLPDCV